MPTFDNVLVTGNQTINQDLQVNGSETIGQHLNVNGSETIGQHLQVNNSQLIGGNLTVNGVISAGGSITSAFRAGVINQPMLPVGAVTTQQVKFYNPGVVNQAGLQLTGTDGLTYILFVDASGATPTLAIQKNI